MSGVDGHYVIPSTFAVSWALFITTAEPCFPQLGFLSNVSSSATPSGIIWLVRVPCTCSDSFFYDALVASSKYEAANNNSG